MRQKSVVWLLFVYVAAMSVLSVMGSPILGAVFIAAVAVQVVVHSIWVCPKCGNYGCAINPKSPFFFLGARKQTDELEKRPALNTLPFILMLSSILALGVYTIWLVSWWLAIVMAVIGGALYFVYANYACKGCPNKCLFARAA